MSDYELRRNPKKSLKLSGPKSDGRRPFEVSCKTCGKAFLKTQQLCGHMRTHRYLHTVRNKNRCNDCGKGFLSARALCGHLRCHGQGIGAPRGLDILFGKGVTRRPRTPRVEISDAHFNSDVKHAAAGLILLSAAAVDALGEDRRVKSVVDLRSDYKVKLVGGLAMSDVLEKPDVEIFNEVSSGLALAADEFKQDGHHSSELELDIKNEDESEAAAVYLGKTDENEISFSKNQLKKDLNCQENFQSVAGPVCSVSCNVVKFTCISCNKEFSSYQALGGHRATKHNVKRGSEMELDIRNPNESKADEIYLAKNDEKGVPLCENQMEGDPSGQVDWDPVCQSVAGPVCSVSCNVAKFRCISCDKEFNSHRALGGHKATKHRVKRRSPVLKIKTYQSSIQLDHVPSAEGKPVLECAAAAAAQADRHGHSSFGPKNIELGRCNHKCAVYCTSYRGVELVEGSRSHTLENPDVEVLVKISADLVSAADEPKKDSHSSEMESDTMNQDESKIYYGKNDKNEIPLCEKQVGGDDPSCLMNLVPIHQSVSGPACSVFCNEVKFRCISCGKEFNSHQALGGHRASKHRVKRCSSELNIKTCKSSIQSVPVPDAEAKPVGPKLVQVPDGYGHSIFGAKNFDHKCAVCFKVFPTGWALGGHMRAHVAIEQVQQPHRTEETSGVEVSMIIQSQLVSRTMLVS